MKVSKHFYRLILIFAALAGVVFSYDQWRSNSEINYNEFKRPVNKLKNAAIDSVKKQKRTKAPTFKKAKVVETLLQKKMEKESKKDSSSPIIIPQIGVKDTGNIREFEICYKADTTNKKWHLVVNRYELAEYTIQDTEKQKQMFSCFEIVYNSIKDQIINNSLIYIDIHGYADGTPVLPGTKYCGDLGNAIFIEFYSGKRHKYQNITLRKNETLLTNEIYALLRGYVLKEGIEHYYPELKGLIMLRTSTFKEIGHKYRGVTIKLKIEKNLGSIRDELS